MSQELQELAKESMALKRIEADAKAKRDEIEKQIVAMIETKEEGTVNAMAGDFKIKIETKLNRTIDAEAFEKIKAQIPEEMRPVKSKLEVDTKGYRYLKENEPKLFLIFAKCVTSKPAKPYVTVEAI
jgi:hypothetical protein